MADVIEFNAAPTVLATDPDTELRRAIGKLDRVTIVGCGKDGREFYATSSTDGALVVFDLERAKLNLLMLPDDEFRD
jgi:hypothetical protein